MARCCSFCGKILPEVGQCDCQDSKAYFEQIIREESLLTYPKEKPAWTAVKIASIVLGIGSLILVCFAPFLTFLTAAAGVVLGTSSVQRSCRCSGGFAL